MNPTDQEFEAVFKNLSDEALLEQCESGNLTAAAQLVAMKVARLRGLHPVEHQPVTEQDEPYFGDFVIVGRELTTFEAHLYKERLESAGIPAEVGNADFARAYSSLYSAVIRVPMAFVDQAQEVLAALSRGEFAIDDDFKSDGE